MTDDRGDQIGQKGKKKARRTCGFGDTASDDLGASAKEMMEAMIRDMPLRTLVTFTNVPDITRAKMSEMVENLNEMLAEK